MSVNLGVLIHSDFGAERPEDLRHYLYRYVRAVEDHKLDAIYIPTEIGWNRYGPLSMLGVLAAWTERVTIGTCVLLAPLYNPLELAEAVATVQVVSGGRVVLGLGLGWRQEEFDAAGVTLDSRLKRLQQHFAVLPELLGGKAVTFKGAHYRLSGVQIGLAEGMAPVPLWLGSHGKPGIARAARQADAWIAGPFAGMSGLKKQIALYRDEQAAAGRTGLTLPLMRECYVAETREEAWKDADPIRFKYQEYVAKLGAMPFDATAPIRDLAAERFVIGDPDDCAAGLARYVQETGATDLILRTQFRGMSPEQALTTIQLLGDEVKPRLDALLAAPGA